jgi:hypothetical protein
MNRIVGAALLIVLASAAAGAVRAAAADTAADDAAVASSFADAVQAVRESSARARAAGATCGPEAAASKLLVSSARAAEGDHCWSDDDCCGGISSPGCGFYCGGFNSCQIKDGNPFCKGAAQPCGNSSDCCSNLFCSAGKCQ